jgi:enamine deaminase RidA (YjgF/YER057c/UK114 family)
MYMNRISASIGLLASVGFMMIFAGCGTDEAAMRQIAREEALKVQAEALAAFAPERMDFGGALAKEWSHAQAVKTGNFIFVSGQQPYDINHDENGLPKTDLETGRSFEQQLGTVFGNIRTALEHYGADMDDVVMLQCFVDEHATTNKAEFGGAAAVVQKFFPNALQSMTFVSVENLYGPQQLIEANAIAVVHE